MRGWLSKLLSLLGAFRIVSSLYEWQLHLQHLKAIRRLAHVQRALLENGFQDMTGLAPERVEPQFILERIVKVVQCITCVHSVSIMLSLATSLTEFAKNVSRSVAIAQAAALVVITRARGIGVTDLLQRVGATSVPRIGRVPSADVRRKLLRNHRQGRFATIVVKVKT